jgi:hypothetical protein
MTTIRDFIYIDFQRLRSFASQLLDKGVPNATTTSETRQTEAGGEVRGRIPLLIEGGANTKGVLSATSTVTADVHHRLIEKVLAGLEHARLLWSEAEMEDAPDGAFVRLDTQIQIIDPDSLRDLVRKLPGATRSLAAASGMPTEAPRTRADKRARRAPSEHGTSLSTAQAEGIANILEIFTPGTVRLRLVRAGKPIATAVVERDKFAEDLDRLIRRHGYLTGGHWETLGQVNTPPDAEIFAPTGETIMDALERDMLGPMRTLNELSGTSAGEGVSITPLAIYRAIESRK